MPALGHLLTVSYESDVLGNRLCLTPRDDSHFPLRLSPSRSREVHNSLIFRYNSSLLALFVCHIQDHVSFNGMADDRPSLHGKPVITFYRSTFPLDDFPLGWCA
jgi:hypothetical protein